MNNLQEIFPYMNPLLVAAFEGNCDRVSQLISDGYDAFCIDENGLTAIHFAIIGNHSNVVEFLSLVAPGLNSIADFDDNTPLHYIAYRGYAHMVKYIIIKIPADEYNNEETCNTINQQTLNLSNLKNNKDQTALDLASSPEFKSEIIRCEKMLNMSLQC